MDGLSGSFATMPIRDLLEYLAGRGLDGTLRCESGSSEKTLVLRGGAVLRASSNDPREHLGQFLLNFGHLTEEELARAFETQKETHVFLGRILVMIGLVEEETVRTLLSLKLRETVIALMGWEHGQFYFSRGELPETDSEIGLEISLDELVSEAELRKSAWSSIRKIFPSDDYYLRPAAEPAPDGPHQPLDERILQLAGQGQTIAEIELSLHSTNFVVHQRLLALHQARAIVPLSPEDFGSSGEILEEAQEDADGLDLEIEFEEAKRKIPKMLGEEASVGQIVSMARDFLSQGRYREARTIGSRAVELAPQHEGAVALMKEAETGLLAELRARLRDRSVVPRVIASPDKLRACRFSPAERYLLKRFDGKKPLMTVLQVSPIKEVEALRIVDAMLDAGVLSLDPQT